MTDRIREELERMQELVTETHRLDRERPTTYAIYVTWHWIHPRGYHTMYRTDGRPVVYITKAVWEAAKIRMMRKPPRDSLWGGILTPHYSGTHVYELEDAYDALKRRR